MTHLKLIIEYDGSEFSGWQSQPNGRTVQDVIEAAIRQITGEDVRIAGGGRTDAGVHAEGQVASFSLQKDLSPEEMRRSLNGVLPADVVVRDSSVVPEDFHARFSARSRTYRYSILRQRTAIRRRMFWSVGWELNSSYLAQCARQIAGTHDFRSFSKVGSEKENWTCSVLRSEWLIEGEEYTFVIEANRFLYGMVRALVGTMVDIGRSHRSLDDFQLIMSAGDRSRAGMAAPPHGLCLSHITY